jgi:hypothetical protein
MLQATIVACQPHVEPQHDDGFAPGLSTRLSEGRSVITGVRGYIGAFSGRLRVWGFLRGGALQIGYHHEVSDLQHEQSVSKGTFIFRCSLDSVSLHMRRP